MDDNVCDAQFNIHLFIYLFIRWICVCAHEYMPVIDNSGNDYENHFSLRRWREKKAGIWVCIVRTFK